MQFFLALYSGQGFGFRFYARLAGVGCQGLAGLTISDHEKGPKCSLQLENIGFFKKPVKPMVFLKPITPDFQT